MKTKTLIAVMLAVCLMASTMTSASATDQLLKSDFKKESFAKVIDFFDYVRAYALLHGLPKPSDNWHAYTYVTYVNKSGMQMLYAGLCNVSFAGAYVTLPMQTVMLHYKTQNNSRDVIVSSSFVMLMGFNDTEQSLFPDSPDRNDNLWASVSIGFNFQNWFKNVTFPSLCSKSAIYPLKKSDDGLTWTWGMRYTNLTAIWYRTFISEDNHTYVKRPHVITTYDELSFNYTLEIKPDENKAVLRQDHTIGRIRDLWHFWGWPLIPFYNHYNSSGCYRYGKKISNETVYDFLDTHQIKMSIIDFQNSVTLEQETYCETPNGENVTDKDLEVDSTISTYCEDGERIFDADFGVKDTYKLYNYTADPTETSYDTYEAVTRTCEIDGIARNEGLLEGPRNVLRYLPLTIAHVDSGLYEKAKDSITNMTKAKYFYIISYPHYSGFRIEHDPVYTAYIAGTPPSTEEEGIQILPWGFVALVVIAVVLIAVVVAAVKLRRKPEQPS